MKRMIKASRTISTAAETFTLVEVVRLLHWIKELRGTEISVSRVSNGDTCLVVGNRAYSLSDILSGYEPEI